MSDSPPGMLARVEVVLKPGEDRSDFIRTAVAVALRRLEQDQAKTSRDAATAAQSARRETPQL